MSDNIPIELQAEIMKRVPVKSLIQFRSVSKTWKSLIDSSRFIADYNSGQHHLLVTYYDNDPDIPDLKKYVSVVDDDDYTFRRQNKVSLTVPQLVKRLKYPSIIGSSHGLLCLYSSKSHEAVIWNPSIRKTVAFVVPNVANYKVYGTKLGFGVCRETNDPKIVKITYLWGRSGFERVGCIPRQVEVFTLSTRAWRSPYSSSSLPQKSIGLFCSQVVIDGFLYWLAIDRTSESSDYELIISFDITSEEFKEVHLPDGLARNRGRGLVIKKLRNSLVVLQLDKEKMFFGVWMMEEGGVSRSFTKLFTIYPPGATVPFVHEFSKSGEPIIEVDDDDDDGGGGGSGGGCDDDDDDDEQLRGLSLVVYEPYSKHKKSLGINGLRGSFFVDAYMETLLLLDQPDSKAEG